MLAAGLVGFVMQRHGFGAAPLVMGLILGKLVEESLSQSMILFDNNWLRFFESPICLLFFVLTALSLSWSPITRAMTRRVAGIRPDVPLDRGD
jgi:putative tricarboxylic transport membrane protein